MGAEVEELNAGQSPEASGKGPGSFYVDLGQGITHSPFEELTTTPPSVAGVHRPISCEHRQPLPSLYQLDH